MGRKKKTPAIDIKNELIAKKPEINEVKGIDEEITNKVEVDRNGMPLALKDALNNAPPLFDLNIFGRI